MIRSIALLTVALLLTVSCSGGSDTDTAQIAPPTPTATVMPSAPTPTQVPPASAATQVPTATLVPTATVVTVVVNTGGTNEQDRDQRWAFTAKEGTFVRTNGGLAKGSTWNNDFNLTLGIWGEQSFYSELLDVATLDKINDDLKRVGQKGRVEFGASSKLKWVDYGPDRLFNPHEHGKTTEGRIYESMIYGRMPDKDYKNAQSDVITPNNIDTFSVGNILYAIHWLHDKKVYNS